VFLNAVYSEPGGCPHRPEIKLDLIFEKTGESIPMKKVIALSAVLTLGALGMACGDAATNNTAANANKAVANAMNTAANVMANAANQAATAANTAANAANAAANAMSNKPAANAMANNANANMKKP
jgi:hypothetical protein